MLNQSELKVEKHLARRVATALGVQADEGLPLMLLFAQSFFMGVMLISFYTAANALFLLEFSAQEIPLVYIVSAGVLTFAGWTFSTLEKRISFPILLMGTYVFLLLSILGLRLGLWLTEGSWLAFALMVWLRLLWIIGNLVIWTLAGRLFNVRQGKRLFTLIGAGAVLGIISSGLLIPLLIRLFGTANLLFVTAIGQVGGLLFLQIAIRQFHDRLTNPSENKEERKTKGGGLGSLPKSRYIFLIFFYTFLSILATYLMDYVFISEAEARYTDVDVLARFFGNYLTFNTSVLLLISLASGQILSRYGVKAGLLLNPVVVMISALTIIATSILLGPISALFWLVVATKLLDDVLGVAMSATSLRILYQPLPSKQPLTMQVAVESVVNPLSVGLVGLLLLLFNAFGNVTTMGAVYLLLFLLACWIAAGIVLNREYTVALKQALTKRHLGDGSLMLTRVERSSIDILKQSLTSRHVGGVIYALDMLEENQPDLLPSLLPDLLSHHAPEVRVDVLRRIERLRLTSTLPTIKAHIKEQHAPRGEAFASVEGASLRVLAALSEAQELQDIYPYLESPRPEVRQGTMIGLLRSGKIEAILAAGQMLLQMVSSPEPAERSLAAQVLGEGGIPFVAPLLTLLQDDDLQVQRAALSAASKLKHAQLWPVVIRRLAEPKVRALAVTALVAGGQAVLTPIKSAFPPQHWGRKEGADETSGLSKQQQGQEVLIRLAKICGRVGGPNAMAFLEQQLDFPDEHVRFHILVALNQCAYQSQDEQFVLQAIKADIAHICWILAVVRDLGAQAPLISTALTSQMSTYRTRLFLWLSFIYDPALIQQLQDTLRVDDVEKKAYVFEIMQTFISNELFALLLPLLDDDAPALQRLESHFPQPKQDHKQRLGELISVANKRLDSWTRACALYSVAESDARDELIDEGLLQAVINSLSAAEPLLRESAAWSISKLDPVNGPHYLEPLRHDPNPSVAKTAIYLTKSATQGDVVMLSIVEKVMALKNSTFFAKPKENVLADVAAMLALVELNAGEILFEKGELGNCMYIIHSGQLRLHDGERTFEQLGEGGAFGELALLDPAPRSGQATAISDTLLLRLDAEPFYELIADHSDVARAIMEVLARRLRRW
jgi:hypothetical protein